MSPPVDPPSVSLVPLAAGLVLACAGVLELERAASARRRARILTLLDEVAPAGPSAGDRVEALLRSTRPGRWLGARLRDGGIGLSVTGVLAGVVAAAAAAAVVTGTVLPAPLPQLAAVGTVAGAGYVLRWRRLRRAEVFAGQVAEVARVLANLTFAGLALPAALAAAPGELPEPAAAEVALASRSIELGRPVQQALDDLRTRLPSRDVTVFVAALTVQLRSGGDMVGALRAIADTLDSRKEVRSEIRSLLAAARANAYVLAVVGVGVLILINALDARALPAMFRSPFGLVALAVAGGMFAGGFVLIRRATRIEL